MVLKMNPTLRKTSSGKNFSDLLQENRSLVVKMMMRKKQCSRSDLAQMTGLTQAAITKIVSGLMEMGIVEEIGIEKVVVDAAKSC